MRVCLCVHANAHVCWAEREVCVAPYECESHTTFLGSWFSPILESVAIRLESVSAFTGPEVPLFSKRRIPLKHQNTKGL